MQKIHQLSPELISKIAAGEIIERPAYVVKELLDNAIDANATNIEIQIEQSGLKKIKVSDNGEGMSREDLIECFKPHTTSKITHEHDLHTIKTLGFRGEALASISAIANISLQSKEKDSVGGSKIDIISGKPSAISSIGMPTGTAVTVTQLFATTPVRKKFLKSLRTEFRHILEVVTNYALSYPSVKIVFTNNHKIVLDLPQNQTLNERIKILLGTSLFQNLIPISFSDNYLILTGFISHPQIATQSPQKQFLYINNRRVTDRAISSVIKDSYSNLIDQTSYPVFILFLTLPVEAVDVNIHPRKEQVSFLDQDNILTMVQQAITNVLESNTSLQKFDWDYKGVREDIDTNSIMGKILREEMLEWDISTLFSVPLNQDIQQIHNLYLIIQTQKGLLIVDQHAAHERILFERLKQEFINQKQQVHLLKKPLIIELSYTEAALVQEHTKTFQNLGFEIEQFKNNDFIIRTAPALLHDRDIKKYVLDICEELQEYNKAKDIDWTTNRILAYIACRAAVMAGDPLTIEQRKKLIKELEQTPNNLTCPHGRPTKIEIPLSHLNKSFKRS